MIVGPAYISQKMGRDELEIAEECFFLHILKKNVGRDELRIAGECYSKLV